VVRALLVVDARELLELVHDRSRVRLEGAVENSQPALKRRAVVAVVVVTAATAAMQR
jgi:hypothetical protein